MHPVKFDASMLEKSTNENFRCDDVGNVNLTAWEVNSKV